jgi:Flp pilus assembly protein TadD
MTTFQLLRLPLLSLSAAMLLAACSPEATVAVAEPGTSSGGVLAANFPDPEQEIGNVELERAIVSLRAIVRMDPSNHVAQVKLGEVYLRTNAPGEAIKQFTAALASSGSTATAKQGLGLAFLRMDDATSAKRYLSEAVADDVTLWRAHLGLGQIADRERDWVAAEAAYATALAQGEHAATYNNLAISYMRQKRYDEAIARFHKSLAMKPDAAVRANLRFAYAMSGDYLSALAGVSKENLPDALNNAGYAAMLRGDYDQAEAYLTRAIEASVSHHATAADNLQLLQDMRRNKLAKATP